MPVDCDMNTSTAMAPARRPLYVTIVLSVFLHVAVIAAVMQIDMPWTGSSDATGVLDVMLAGPGTDTDMPEPASATEVSTDELIRVRAESAQPEPLATAMRPPALEYDSRRFLPTTVGSAATAVAAARYEVLEDYLPPLDIPIWEPELAVHMDVAERQMLEQRLEDWLNDPEQLINASDAQQWEFDGALYEVNSVTVPARSATGLDRTIIEVTTSRGGRLMSTRMELKRLAFSHYAQFINHWDSNVYLSRDRIEGRFHSNSAVNIDTATGERPQFAGPVTIAAVQSRSRSLQRSGMFEAGLQTMADRIPLSSDTDPAPVAALEDDTRVYHFTADTFIRFHGNGDFTWWTAASTDITVREPAAPGTLMLLAEDGVSLSVQGQVAGTVLVYSPRMIRITGNLIYASNPLDDVTSEDWLSLISDHTIQVADAGVTGPGDLHIHGALYARNRFSVRGFRRGNNDAVLSIIGSLVAGSVSATEPRYATEVIFDPRLEFFRAPGFPMTTRYALESRDEHWTLASNR